MILIYCMPVVKYGPLSDSTQVADFKVSSDEILLYWINFKYIPLKYQTLRLSPILSEIQEKSPPSYTGVIGKRKKEERLPPIFPLWKFTDQSIKMFP